MRTDQRTKAAKRARTITLQFRLAEDVTPDYFARRVAEACFSYGALRTGEAVVLPSDPTLELRDGGPVVLPPGLFGRASK